MGWISRLFDALSPPPGAVEAETRRWRLACKTCGRWKNLWDAGGVRYRASGTKSVRGYCSGCDAWRWLTVERIDEASADGSQTPPS